MPKILIVEDDFALARGLRDNFKLEGFDTEVAFDGTSGLEMALNETQDIILLDVMLPGVNGFDICAAIRREGYDVPIIMLTAKGREQDIVKGLHLGADDYVTKPFSIKELIARVHAFLRRHRPLSETLIEFGNCKLDRQSCRFEKAGREISLTRKEYQLLEFFLENSGKALTRQSIMSRVWGNSLVVTQRSVDRCVTTLRSKVEDEPSSPRHITTVRDVGYRFES